MESFDPYTILNIKKGFTIEELKEQYKKMVYLHHPDKNPNVANTPVFQILTAAYKILLTEHKQKSSDKQHFELKNSFTNNNNNVNYQNIDIRSFNIEKFNDVFGKTRIDDVYTSSGYNQWFQKEDISDEKDRSLVKYKEPLSACGSSAAKFYELGKDNISDWSGDNTNKKELHFMDCRVAYTTKKLVDENVVDKKKEYKNVEELENDRSNIQYTSEEAIRYMKRKKKKEEAAEKKRIEALSNYDRIIEQKHLTSNKLMLGLN